MEKTLFYNWEEIKKISTSYKDVEYIIKALLSSAPIPRKLNSRIKPYKYYGNSFLLNPKTFLNVKCQSEYKLQALEIASVRNYSDYTLYGDVGVPLFVSPFNKQILISNPLLELKNDTIFIHTGKIWH